jgi:hypothetical protein
MSTIAHRREEGRGSKRVLKPLIPVEFFRPRHGGKGGPPNGQLGKGAWGGLWLLGSVERGLLGQRGTTYTWLARFLPF